MNLWSHNYNPEIDIRVNNQHPMYLYNPFIV